MNYEAQRAQVRDIIAKSAISPDAKSGAEDLALALLAGGETPEESARVAVNRAESGRIVEGRCVQTLGISKSTASDIARASWSLEPNFPEDDALIDAAVSDALAADVEASTKPTPKKANKTYTRDELAARVNEITGKNLMQTKANTEAHNVANSPELIREVLKIEAAPIESRFIAAGLRPLGIHQVADVATVAVASAGGQRGFPQIGNIGRERSQQVKRHCEALLTRELEEAAPGSLDAALAAEVAKALDVAAAEFFAGKATAAADQAELIEATAKMTAPVLFVSPAGLASLVAGDFLENGKAFGVFRYILLPHASGFRFLAIDTHSAYLAAELGLVQRDDSLLVEGADGARISAFQSDMCLKFADCKANFATSKPEAVAKLV